jgi:carboxypeptidase C (cathepsin A)
MRFVSHVDKFARPTQYYVAGLLERGVRVLIYAGTYDWQCNWVSNVYWTERLEWSGGEEYQKAEWRDWSVEKGGEKAGETKSWGPLTFVTVRGAGHMVPFDKPAESLAMVSRWLAEEDV